MAKKNSVFKCFSKGSYTKDATIKLGSNRKEEKRMREKENKYNNFCNNILVIYSKDIKLFFKIFSLILIIPFLTCNQHEEKLSFQISVIY